MIHAVPDPTRTEQDAWLQVVEDTLAISAIRLGIYATNPASAVAAMDEPIQRLLRLARERLETHA